MSVNPPSINFQIPEPVFIKLGVYIMASEPISAAYFINPSRQSLWLYVYPSIIARQQLSRNVTEATKAHATNRRIIGCIVFYEVHAISKEGSRLISLQFQFS
jgi:hypothetical protein